MADYSAEDLAIIVRYDGTKTAFNAIADKSAYYGRVVFITGTTTNGVTSGQAIWVSETGSTTGKYLDMSNIDDIAAQLTYVRGLKVGGSTYAGTITLAGANGVSVTINANTSTITFAIDEAITNRLSEVETKSSNNATSIATLQSRVNTLTNTSATKTELENGVKEAKGYTDTEVAAAKEALIGGDDDTIESNTIKGNANAIAENTEAIEALGTSTTVTMTSINGVGNTLKTYTLKQGTTTIGTIDIPKDLVVTSGSVVNGTWSGGTFSENTSGSDTAIKLVIANQTTPIYINVKDLVDVYTAAQSASQVQLTISSDNVISATLVNSGITNAHLSTALKTSIALANSAYQKPAAGIPVTDLAEGIQTTLSKAFTNGAGDNTYVTIGKQSVNEGQQFTVAAIIADIEDEDDGLVSAADLRNYLAARLSVKVIS